MAPRDEIHSAVELLDQERPARAFSSLRHLNGRATVPPRGGAARGGPQSFTLFALNLLLSRSLGSMVTTLVGGIGEELGWRGFLQPALERRFGRFRGTVLVGLVWAFWHLPVNTLGYNDSEHPLLNAWVFFPLAVVAMSFGFAWLTQKSGSAWPAAVAHGANNTIGAAFLLTPKTWSAGTLTELASMGMISAGFVWAALRQERATPTAEEPRLAVTS